MTQLQHLFFGLLHFFLQFGNGGQGSGLALFTLLHLFLGLHGFFNGFFGFEHSGFAFLLEQEGLLSSLLGLLFCGLLHRFYGQGGLFGLFLPFGLFANHAARLFLGLAFERFELILLGLGLYSGFFALQPS